MIGTIKKALTKMLTADKENEWDEELPLIERTYRARRGKDGFSPFFLMFARQCRLGDVNVDIVSSDIEKQEEGVNVEKRVFEISAVMGPRCSRRMRRTEQDAKFRVGEEVMLLKPETDRKAKLTTTWTGPFTVLEIRHPGYHLKDSR